jgi:hypothetical protein
VKNQLLRSKFPTHRNREFFSRIRETFPRNSESEGVNRELAGDDLSPAVPAFGRMTWVDPLRPFERASGKAGLRRITAARMLRYGHWKPPVATPFNSELQAAIKPNSSVGGCHSRPSALPQKASRPQGLLHQSTRCGGVDHLPQRRDERISQPLVVHSAGDLCAGAGRDGPMHPLRIAADGGHDLAEAGSTLGLEHRQDRGEISAAKRGPSGSSIAALPASPRHSA